MDLQQQWLEQGYVVVRGVFSQERSARLCTICDDILSQWRMTNPENGKPGGDTEATVMRHLNHPGYFSQHREWLSEVLDAVADESVLHIARVIFGEEPLFRCTSLFFNPLTNSRDGDWHRDSQFSWRDDQTERVKLAEHGHEGFGMQLQIALLPSADIEFVPGSHRRWDTPEEYYIRKADDWAHNRSNDMPGALRIAQEPGDAVLFNPSGIHRGRYHTDKLRRTLMLTYTRTSEPYYDYFSHQPWVMQPGYLDGLREETRRFFVPFMSAYEIKWRQETT